jgi:hypothetical protein
MPERKGPLGRPSRRWEDDTKMDIKEIRWDGVDWINLAEDRDRCRAVGNMVVEVEMCTVLGYYAALSSSSVPTFRDNLSDQCSRVKRVYKMQGIS